MIIDSAVTVKHYFEEEDQSDAQENKPRARILAELLAAGYKIHDQIIEKGIEIDAKFGVTTKLNSYVESAKAQAQALDEKFKVSEKATELDHKYHVQDRVNAAVEQGKDYSNQALQSAPVQKVTGIAVQVKDQIAAVHNEARRIADEKKVVAAAQAHAAEEAKAPEEETPVAAPSEVPAAADKAHQ